jgi:ParB/RepB/Spo0J family partition protein
MLNRSSKSKPTTGRATKQRGDQRAEALKRLFPVTAEQQEAVAPGQRDIGGLKMIARDHIIVHRQFRQDAAGDVEGLRSNIAEMKERNLGVEGTGILEPLIVSPAKNEDGSLRPGYYDLIAGERRFHASEGFLQELPCISVESNERASKLIQGIENVHRKNFTPLEEAEFVYSLRHDLDLSIREQAAILGENRGWVANRLDLYGAGEDVKEFLQKNQGKPGATMTNALIIDGEKKDHILRRRLLHAAKEGGTERVLRAIVDAHKGKSADSSGSAITVTTNGSTVTMPPTAAIPANQGTTPNYGSTAFGQQSAGTGLVAPPSDQKPDALRQFIQPAGSMLAEGVRRIKSGEATPPPAKALDAAIQVIEVQLKQLKNAQVNK